jgi:Rrf2 family protein
VRVPDDQPDEIGFGAVLPQQAGLEFGERCELVPAADPEAILIQARLEFLEVEPVIAPIEIDEDLVENLEEGRSGPELLAFQGMGEVCSKKDIARTMDIPDQFLGKIAQQLARAGIIEIVQGPKGGYRLLLSPEKLTMLDVVETVIGEIYLNDCVVRPESCERASLCAIHRVWEKARDQLRETLRETDFKSVLEEENCTVKLLKAMETSQAK